MGYRSIAALIFCVLVGAQASAAATLSVDVVDQGKTPVSDAVVSLEPQGAAIASRLPEKAVIDQRDETFIPLVVIVRKGGRIIFTNNDETMHQVYSFSPIKQFQFLIKQGETSPAITFDQAGVAAIGCNIHDHMIAYAYVGSAPIAVVTDAKGHVVIPDVPAGIYRLVTWHPQLPIGASAPTVTVTVAGSDLAETVALPFAVTAMHGMKHMHMDY